MSMASTDVMSNAVILVSMQHLMMKNIRSKMAHGRHRNTKRNNS